MGSMAGTSPASSIDTTAVCLDSQSGSKFLTYRAGRPMTYAKTSGVGSTVAWAPDGRLIYSLGEPSPNQNDSNLWALPLDSAGHVKGPATRLTHGPGLADLVSVTLDGKRLAFFRRTIEPDVYVTDIEANGSKVSPPRRLTLSEPTSPMPGHQTVSPLFSSPIAMGHTTSSNSG
jgi:Tol biopolymer transport system component